MINLVACPSEENARPSHRLIISVSYGVTTLQKQWLIVDLMLRILSVSIPISVMFVTNNHTIEIDFYLKLSFKINLLFTDTVYFRFNFRVLLLRFKLVFQEYQFPFYRILTKIKHFLHFMTITFRKKRTNLYLHISRVTRLTTPWAWFWKNSQSLNLFLTKVTNCWLITEWSSHLEPWYVTEGGAWRCWRGG